MWVPIFMSRLMVWILAFSVLLLVWQGEARATPPPSIKTRSGFRSNLCTYLCNTNPAEGGTYCNCDKHPLGKRSAEGPQQCHRLCEIDRPFATDIGCDCFQDTQEEQRKKRSFRSEGNDANQEDRQGPTLCDCDKHSVSKRSAPGPQQCHRLCEIDRPFALDIGCNCSQAIHGRHRRKRSFRSESNDANQGGQETALCNYLCKIDPNGQGGAYCNCTNS